MLTNTMSYYEEILVLLMKGVPLIVDSSEDVGKVIGSDGSVVMILVWHLEKPTFVSQVVTSMSSRLVSHGQGLKS